MRDVLSYADEGDVLWFSDMPHDRDCTSPAWGGGEEDDSSSWLCVRQQILPPLPEVPASVEPWIDEDQLTNTHPDHEPALRAVAFLHRPGSEAPEEHRLADHAEVAAAWERYLPKWRAWRVARRRVESIQRIYSRLFSIYQRQTKLGELYELVVGLGLLQWRRRTGDIRRHCFVVSAELRFDRERGEIRLLCPAGGARLRLEDEMIEIADRPPREHYDALQAHLSEWEDELWSAARSDGALKEWGRSLHPDVRCELHLERGEGEGDAPLIDLAPAIILRKRGAQSTVKLYEEMIAQLKAPDAEPSFGLTRLVEDIDDASASDGGIDHAAVIENTFSPANGRIYFPKPANRDQREIIARLRRHRGILVQGPPGTGKSHTIANLICHLLAEGKRVLVTSETPRALRVLKDKIPPELQPLCVSNLGGDADSFRELESCVNGITRRHAGWNRRAYESEIADAESELDQVQRKIAVLDRKLHDLRRHETEEHVTATGGSPGTPSALAQHVAEHESRFSWCALERDGPGTPPLSAVEFGLLVSALREITVEAAHDAAMELPNVEVLPDRNAFAVAVGEIDRHHSAAREVETLHTHPAFPVFLRSGTEWRQELRALLATVREKRTELARRPHDWRLTALRDVLSGRALRWERTRKETATLAGSIESRLGDLDASKIEAPVGYTDERLLHDVEAALELLRAGKRWGIFGLKLGPLAPFLHLKRECRLNGIPAATVTVLEKMQRVLDATLRLRRAWALWEGVESPPAGGALVRYAELVEAARTLDAVFEIARTATEASQFLSRHHASVPNWLNDDETELLRVLDAAERTASLREAEQKLEDSAEALRGIVGPRVHPVIECLRTALRARDVSQWAAAVEEVARLHNIRVRLKHRDELLERLRMAAPRLAGALQRAFAEEVWTTRTPDFPAAWTWARTDHWLQERTTPGLIANIEAERRRLVEQWETAMSRVASAKAWLAFLERLSPAQSAALQAWTNAVRSLGKGTGKSVRAVRLRQEARSYATQASSALPAWIMPRYKVVEMIRPDAEKFDVVIVDEASQSGIDSLFLFHIARQIVVVGDDQQISPNVGFIEAERIAALQNLHLRNVRHKVALDVNSSLYDNARIRFQAAVVLREHFRCMPEIIQFSNDLCYAPNGTPLDPLRTYSESRLSPVVTTFVPEGFREGGASNALNLAEAESLVEQVQACIADPRYAGKSMGVISLQGSAQAQKIHQLLVSTIGAVEMEERDLVCGDAYDFQGDERDVMFLSLVAAPNERIGVLAKTADHQRFNVAASRARDQLWLFHSAALEDLSPSCVRYRLLDYMLAPRRMTDDASGTVRFDSEFERHVYERIVARGFSVRTQVAVGDALTHRYRIDLVVEGMRGRLAVECDGDKWHGPERFEADMRRQRDLERAGWRFWRVRGGEFYRDRERALATLWGTLGALGVAACTEAPPGDDATNSARGPEPEPRGKSSPPPPPPAEPTKTAGPISASSISPRTNGNSSTIAPHEKITAPSPSPKEPASVWRIRPLPDPRQCSPEQIIEAFTEIVRAEGPVLCSRVYALYLQAAGIGRLGAQIKTQLNRSMARAVRSGRFAQDQDDSVGQLDKTVRLPGTPSVIVRTGSARRWDEVPRSELRALATKFLQETSDATDSEIVRRVYEAYGGERLRNDTARDLSILLRPVLTSNAQRAEEDTPQQTDLFDHEPQAATPDKIERMIRVQVTPHALRTGTLNLDDGYVDGALEHGEHLDVVGKYQTFLAVVDPDHERPTLRIDSAKGFFAAFELNQGDWLELRQDESGKWRANRAAR